MKRLVVGLVLDDTLDTPDGVQQYVLNIGGWLTAQGHEVHYLVGETNRTDLQRVHALSRNVKVRFNANRMSMPLPTSRPKLHRFLAEQKFDVLHVQVPYSPFLAGRLVQLAPPQTAIVGTFHILPYSHTTRFANKLLGLLNSRSARRFDELVAVSEPAARFAEQMYGFRDVAIVPNPVKLSQFARARSRSKTTNIVFLGRLERRKGALLLLRAVATLLKQNPELAVRVLIGGKGNLLGELKTFIDEHGLGKIVSLEGFIAEADKADFLAQADIAVYPSTGGESFGIVLLEAMAAARGVVLAGDNPGYRSVMADREEQLVQPTMTAAFAEKLDYWLQHNEARQQAAAWQKSYVQRFDVAVVGAQVEALYGRALQKRRAS